MQYLEPVAVQHSLMGGVAEWVGLPLLQHIAALRGVNGVGKQVDVPTERVLVHGLNVGQVSY